MQLLEITLNLTSFEAIGGGLMLVVGLFGAPYLVRAENKKKLDLKADIEQVQTLQKIVEKKASYEFVSKHIDDIKQDLKDHTRSNDGQFESLRSELSCINTNILKVLTEVKRQS